MKLYAFYLLAAVTSAALLLPCKGYGHEVTWEGNMKTINGVPPALICTRGGGFNPRKEALIYLTGVFGLPHVNNKLLACNFWFCKLVSSKIGYKRFLTTGYCFGGLYALKLAQRNMASVSTLRTHQFELPDDFEVIRKKSHVPIQVNSAEFDDYFNLTSQALVDDIMHGYKAGYNRTFFAGVGHGFAVRADLVGGGLALIDG
ncbi:hypothetical protein BT69DRAFT_1320035 [Atractiella rhizophila]|nr:hypothetical protein BT69DRAFT_1320035 [Atractiella rhizophila]